MKMIKNIFRKIILAICGLILGINIYMINATRLLGDKLPMPFGYGAAVVLSGSMEPSMSIGDLIVIKQTDEFNVEDIIVYQSRSMLVVHRIVEIDGESIITKGDANNAPDNPISLASVKGKVVCQISKVGYFLNWMKTPLGAITVILVTIGLLKFSEDDTNDKILEEKLKLEQEIERIKNNLS